MYAYALFGIVKRPVVHDDSPSAEQADWGMNVRSPCATAGPAQIWVFGNMPITPVCVSLVPMFSFPFPSWCHGLVGGDGGRSCHVRAVCRAAVVRRAVQEEGRKSKMIAVGPLGRWMLSRRARSWVI